MQGYFSRAFFRFSFFFCFSSVFLLFFFCHWYHFPSPRTVSVKKSGTVCRRTPAAVPLFCIFIRTGFTVQYVRLSPSVFSVFHKDKHGERGNQHRRGKNHKIKISGIR